MATKKRPAQSRSKSPSSESLLPLTLEAFDNLPNSAFVPVPIIAALRGESVATTLRRIADGSLPALVTTGKRTRRMNVGAYRHAAEKLNRP